MSIMGDTRQWPEPAEDDGTTTEGIGSVTDRETASGTVPESGTDTGTEAGTEADATADTATGDGPVSGEVEPEQAGPHLHVVDDHRYAERSGVFVLGETDMEALRAWGSAAPSPQEEEATTTSEAEQVTESETEPEETPETPVAPDPAPEVHPPRHVLERSPAEAEMRIGTTERNALIDALARGVTGGYLDQEAFDARCRVVMDAVTVGDVRYVVADLPASVRGGDTAGQQRRGTRPYPGVDVQASLGVAPSETDVAAAASPDYTGDEQTGEAAEVMIFSADSSIRGNLEQDRLLWGQHPRPGEPDRLPALPRSAGQGGAYAPEQGMSMYRGTLPMGSWLRTNTLLHDVVLAGMTGTGSPRQAQGSIVAARTEGDFLQALRSASTAQTYLHSINVVTGVMVVLGILFSPAMLLSALLGHIVGSDIVRHRNNVSRGDMKIYRQIREIDSAPARAEVLQYVYQVDGQNRTATTKERLVDWVADLRRGRV